LQQLHKQLSQVLRRCILCANLGKRVAQNRLAKNIGENYKGDGRYALEKPAKDFREFSAFHLA
jgi:hypothetical protein